MELHTPAYASPLLLLSFGQIFRFYYRCTNCAAEFTMKTDPKSSDYIMEEGASRNYEPWREVRRLHSRHSTCFYKADAYPCVCHKELCCLCPVLWPGTIVPCTTASSGIILQCAVLSAQLGGRSVSNRVLDSLLLSRPE